MKTRIAAIAMGLAVGSVVGLTAAGVFGLVQHGTASPVTPHSFSPGIAGLSIDPRSDGSCSGSSAIGVAARLRTGHTIGELRAAGYDARPLVGSPNGAAAVGTGDLVVIHGGGSTATDTAAQISGSPAVSAAGVVHAQSSRSALHSCMYDLGDRPQAAALLRSAEAAAEAQQYLPVSASVVMALVSDNPIDGRSVLVTMDIDGGVTAHESGPLGGDLHSLHAVVALEGLDGTVQQVGYGAW